MEYTQTVNCYSKGKPYLCLVTKVDRELLDEAQKHRLRKVILSKGIHIKVVKHII